MRCHRVAMLRVLLLLPALLSAAAWSAELPRATLQDGVSMLPLRLLAQWCGARVSYVAAPPAVTLQWPGHACELPLAGPRLGTAMLDGAAVTVAPAPRAVDGTLYVPAAFLARVFAVEATADADREYITLKHPTRDETFAVLTAPRVLLAGVFFGAVERADAVTTRRLLDIDARLVEARDIHGATPLHAAAGSDGALTALLLTAGAPSTVRDARGWTPLHVAAHAGPLEAVEALLKADADTAAQTPAGETPLALAQAAGRPDIAALLPAPQPR